MNAPHESSRNLLQQRPKSNRKPAQSDTGIRTKRNANLTATMVSFCRTMIQAKRLVQQGRLRKR